MTYKGGVASYYNADGRLAGLVDHSFLVFHSGERSIVFDVARRNSSGWPRLVVMDRPITLDTFIGQDNLLVAGRSPFSRSPHKELFGVGGVLLGDEPKVLA